MTTCNVYPQWDLETEEGYYAKNKGNLKKLWALINKNLSTLA